MTKKSEGGSGGGGKAIKVPIEVYKHLLELKETLYPNLSIAEVAALKIRKGAEEDEKKLESFRLLRKQYPDKTPEEIRDLALSAGLSALASRGKEK